MIYLSYKKNFVSGATMAGIAMNEVADFDSPTQLVAFMVEMSHKMVTTYERNLYKVSDFMVLWSDNSLDNAVKVEYIPPFKENSYFAFYVSYSIPADIVDKFARQYMRNQGKHGNLDSVTNLPEFQCYFYKIAWQIIFNLLHSQDKEGI